MTSELIDAIFGASVIAIDDLAIIDALCETETALARACARSGLIELSTAFEIGAVCEQLRRTDVTELARRSVAGGNPVIPLVAEIRAHVERSAGADSARAVHLGATSQDILDTALMLLSKRALGQIGAGLGAAADSAARLAAAHRDTAMAGRTLLQQAVPTTFGALAATWGSGLDRSRARIAAVHDGLPVQLGGAAGTLAPLYPHGAEVRAALADELDLADPGYVWHTDRTVVTEVAGALGTCAAAVSKVATDLILLAQSEIGEVRERAPGGSSAMAHKQNPIAAITARAAAAQVPGLVATLLAAGSPELQRGAGPWHAEWPALLGLLRFCGGAVSRLQVALDIDVNAEAMRANLAHLDVSGDMSGAVSDTGHATDLVDHYVEGRER